MREKVDDGGDYDDNEIKPPFHPHHNNNEAQGREEVWREHPSACL